MARRVLKGAVTVMRHLGRTAPGRGNTMQTQKLTMTRLLILLALAGLAMGLDGCDTAPGAPVLESEVVAQTTQERLTTMSTSVDGATSWVDQSSFTAEVFRAVGLGDEDVAADASVLPFDPATLAANFADFLETRVLLPSNVVVADESSVTYGLLAADLLCTDRNMPGQTGTSALVAYTQCRILYADLELLVLAEMVHGGMDLTLMVGRDALKPLTVELRDQRTVARTDLAQFREALALFVERMPENRRQSWPSLSALEGEVVMAIETLSVNVATATVEVTRAIDGILEEHGNPLSFSFAPGTLSLLADGEARELVLTADVGALELEAAEGWRLDGGMEMQCAPGDVACKPTQRVLQVDGAIGALLAGLTGEARVEETTELVELKGVGLGPETSRVTLNHKDVISLDLNPADGRTLDLALERDETGLTAEVAPLLDLSLGLFAENAQEVFHAAAHSWMANEVLEISLDEDELPAVRFGVPGVRVQRGVLSLTSQAMPELDKILEAGHCLHLIPSGAGHRVSPSSYYAPAHPFAGLSSGACDEL